MRQALAHNVERAPNGAEDEFDVGVPFVTIVQADSNRSLTNHDSPNVVKNAHGRDFDTVEKFEDISGDENLGANYQDVAHSDQ